MALQTRAGNPALDSLRGLKPKAVTPVGHEARLQVGVNAVVDGGDDLLAVLPYQAHRITVLGSGLGNLRTEFIRPYTGECFHWMFSLPAGHIGLAPVWLSPGWFELFLVCPVFRVTKLRVDP